LNRRCGTPEALTTVFGTVELVRMGYSRPGAPGVFPLDRALTLPARSFSYELQRRLVKRAPVGWTCSCKSPSEPVRRFECFTVDLHRLADWLEACEVATVAMQSTGVYWIPLYEILQERGFEVYLVNARHTKNLPGRKSDVQESQWLLKLHTYTWSSQRR
jgi:Transposase